MTGCNGDDSLWLPQSQAAEDRGTPPLRLSIMKVE